MVIELKLVCLFLTWYMRQEMRVTSDIWEGIDSELVINEWMFSIYTKGLAMLFGESFVNSSKEPMWFRKWDWSNGQVNILRCLGRTELLGFIGFTTQYFLRCIKTWRNIFMIQWRYSMVLILCIMHRWLSEYWFKTHTFKGSNINGHRNVQILNITE